MELHTEHLTDQELADLKERLLRDLNEAEFNIHRVQREQEKRREAVPNER